MVETHAGVIVHIDIVLVHAKTQEEHDDRLHAVLNRIQALTKPTVLALSHPNIKIKIRADASAYGLGAILLQYHEGKDWKPIAYAAKSMTQTLIEKEALALVWACEKFADYVIGKHIQIKKPLVPLFGTTQLHSLPPRVLRFRLRLTRFNYSSCIWTHLCSNQDSWTCIRKRWAVHWHACGPTTSK